MVGILLMTHAPLASAFLAAATHVYKQTPRQVHAFDVLADQAPDETVAAALIAAQAVDTGDGVLILTDVLGATPANCAQRVAAQCANARLLHGLSVPMLLRSLCYRDLPLAQVAQKALEGGQNGAVLDCADEQI
ncbi:MAG: PTS sugar transporter subunit IIA [Formosimonas sp.]